jgi:BTB/POZ domain-containing protein 7
MVQEAELVRLRRARYIPDIPDTLYMVDEKPRITGAVGVDILAAALPGTYSILFLRFNST